MPRIVGADDRRDGEVGGVLVADGHDLRAYPAVLRALPSVDVHRIAAALIAARALGGDENAVVTVDGEPRLLTAT